MKKVLLIAVVMGFIGFPISLLAQDEKKTRQGNRRSNYPKGR